MLNTVAFSSPPEFVAAVLSMELFTNFSPPPQLLFEMIPLFTVMDARFAGPAASSSSELEQRSMATVGGETAALRRRGAEAAAMAAVSCSNDSRNAERLNGAESESATPLAVARAAAGWATPRPPRPTRGRC